MAQGEHAPLYRIRNWNAIYENNRSRELRRADWLPLPNESDSDEYTELVCHRNGAAHFGVFVALLKLASRCEPRGTLTRSLHVPHTIDTISRISRIDSRTLRAGIERLLSIGLLECVNTPETSALKRQVVTPQTSHPDAVESHDAASSRARAFGTERTEGKEGGTPQDCDVLDECDRIRFRLIERHKTVDRNPLKISEIERQFSVALSERPDDPVAFALKIDTAHAAMCQTEKWQRKYAEGLDRWLQRGGWRDELPVPAELNGQAHDLSMDEQDRMVAEYKARRG